MNTKIEVLPGSTVLPKHFEEVARFAAIEVFVRGVGDKQQYNYSIKDVITCAAAYQHFGSVNVSDVTIRNLGGKRTAVTLHNAYRRHVQALHPLAGVSHG